MIQDIFVPSKIGSYYIFSKRVLGFEVTTSCVQASLIYFSSNKVVIENSMMIALQDQNQNSIVNAIKKIATTIGKYDEVVTSLTSSAVIFKELTLPFIGREKIKMIVNYEVEPLLPFSLDDAVIDFLVTQEDKDTSQTTILVAAVRKTDLENYMGYFEKAGVVVHNVTLDMFALYDFYRHSMYVAQAYTSLLLVDFGIDAIRILYIQKGVLKSVRLVPHGLFAMMSKLSSSMEISSQQLFTDILEHADHQHDQAQQGAMIEQLILDFAKQINLSVSFFAKQIKNFIEPARVVCLGAGTQLQDFAEQASQKSKMTVEILDIKRIAQRNNIEIARKIKINGQRSMSVIIPLSAADYGEVNFLSHEHQKVIGKLLNKQLLVAALISIAMVGTLYFYSHYQLKKWNIAYEKSRRELVKAVRDQMGVEVKSNKRIHDIVTAAQTKLEQEEKFCSSFSQSNKSMLNHLEELFTHIDRESLGVDLKKISMQDKEIVLQGKISPSAFQPDPYKNLANFERELNALPSFTLKSRLPELSFTAILLVKEDQENKKE